MNLTFQTTPLAPTEPLDLEALTATRSRRLDPSLRDAFVTEGATAQLERLFTPGAFCVTTGQQPGLFTGPLFTLYKALSTIALARHCETQLGRPVVPVFWVAGDDHDLAEAGHVDILDLNNERRRLALPPRPTEAPLTPLYRETLGAEVSALVDAIRDATPATEYRDEILDWLRRHYRRGADLAGAFAGAVAELLGGEGLLVLRPTHGVVKRAMQRYLLTALEQAPALDRVLGERRDALRQADLEPPVPVGEGATLVMLEGELGRDRLVADDGMFHARRSGERYHLDDLRALARETPERLSPNVLLRPVVEAALLPTLAYVAGPGELAYLPQCDPIYTQLEIAPQARVARWSAWVIEARVRKVLDKYDLRVDDLYLPEGQLERRLVDDDMPAAAREALVDLRRALAARYEALRDAAVEIDPTLKKPIESAQHGALKALKDVEKRMVSHLKQQNEVLLQQVAKARQHLVPAGKPQERVLNATPYLIRYGRQFLAAALEEADRSMAALVSPTAKP